MPEPEDIALDHGDAAHAPVLARPRGFGIERADVGDHARGQLLGPIEDARLGAGEPGQAGRHAGHRRRALHLPGVEHLQRAGPALGLGPKHRWARSCAMTSAAWSAAAAASCPLLPALPPARSTACCMVSTVSTPNPTGSACRTATSLRPRAASPATYSKCGVSPRMTAPSATRQA